MNLSERVRHLERRVNVLEYEAYLKSEKWKALREECFRLAGYQCEYCGAVSQLSAHHVRYPKGGFKYDSVENLVAACSRCHGINHGIRNRPEPKPDRETERKRVSTKYRGRHRDLLLALMDAEDAGDKVERRKVLVELQEIISAGK